VPLTGRKQLNLVSDDQINQAAAQSYTQLLSDPKTTVVTGTADAERVKRVGSLVANAIQRYLKQNGLGSQYANYKWEFNLIQSKEVNAWCMPGGKVAVYTGILPLTQNDAGLAVVLGHEIGHAIAHHSAERISQEMLAQGVGSVLGTAAGSSSTVGVINEIYGVGGQLVLLSHSRSQESEADRLGLTFMAMAGYDPHEAIPFWQRMAAQNKGGSPPVFLSTHPADDQRIKDIQNRIPEAMKYYQH
jgi:predicted Zn-dependent protease